MTPMMSSVRRRVGDPPPQDKPRSQHSKKKKPRPIPHLNFDSDNDARAVWRTGRVHDATFDLPVGCDPNKDVGTLQCFRFIGASTGTHLVHKKRADGNAFTVRIWGMPEQVARAKSQLAAYSNDAHLADRSRSFARINASQGWARETVNHEKLVREAKRQKYRRSLHAKDVLEMTFAHSIALPWPEDGWKTEDYLGQQLEAIDNIRMDGQCYINLDRRPETAVTTMVLLGDYLNKMNNAVTRLQAIPHRVLSHKLDSIQLFLVKPVTASPFDYGSYKIQLIEYFPPDYVLLAQRVVAPREAPGKIPVLQPTGTTDYDSKVLEDDAANVISLDEIEAGAVWLGFKYAAHINQQYLHMWTTLALEHLAYYSGYVKMEFNLGVCVLGKNRRNRMSPDGDEMFSIDVLEDRLLAANADGEELGAYMPADNIDVEQKLLKRFFNARGILFFTGFTQYDWTLDECVERCYPHYTAAFILEQNDDNNLRLELEYQRGEGKDYNLISKQWSRLNNNEKEAEKFLNINMFDLENPNASYGLTISRCVHLTELQVAKLSPIFRRFADSVKFDVDTSNNMAKTERYFTFPENTNVKLLQYQQCRSWVFKIGLSGYLAELYTITTVDVKPDPWRLGVTKSWPRQERWGIRVYHQQWSLMFLQNKELAIGEKTKWQPTEEQFFPSYDRYDFDTDMEGMEAETGAGFEELMRIMKIVEDVAEKEIQVEKLAQVDDILARIDKLLKEENEASATMATSGILIGGLPAPPAPPSPVPYSTATLINSSEDTEVINDMSHGPSRKQRRNQTTKRYAVIQSLDAPTSVADVRNVHGKNFSAIEDKLYQQSPKKSRGCNNAGNTRDNTPSDTRLNNPGSSLNKVEQAASGKNKGGNMHQKQKPGSHLHGNTGVQQMPNTPVRGNGGTQQKATPSPARTPAQTKSWADVAKTGTKVQKQQGYDLLGEEEA